MTTSIESLWYQRKITGYGANGSFPTEMTVVYTVGVLALLPNGMQNRVLEIGFSKSEYKINFGNGYLLSIPIEVNPEILYKTIEDGNTTEEAF